MSVRKFRLIDYRVIEGLVDVTTGKLQEDIKGEPLRAASWSDIGPCDMLTVGSVIFQKQNNDRFRKVQVCGGGLDLELIKREKHLN